MSGNSEDIAGYTYGRAQVAPSPVTAAELNELKASVMFSADDENALRTAGDVLEDQVSAVLDTWYGFVSDNPHLLASFSTPAGEPIQAYLQQVRARFEQWVLDTCRRPYDQAWLDYQEEIGLRHTWAKKNQTDSVDAQAPVPLRHVIGLVYPITTTMRPFLAAKGHSDSEVEAMWQAWFKAVTLQVALWSRPYAIDGHW